MDGPRACDTKSEAEGEISYDILYMCNYKEMIQMNLPTKQKDSQTQKMNLWLLGGRVGGRDSWGGWDGHVHTAVF